MNYLTDNVLQPAFQEHIYFIKQCDNQSIKMKKAESSWIHGFLLPKPYGNFSPDTMLSSKACCKRQRNPSAWGHRLGSKTLLTEDNNDHAIIFFIIPKNKFVRRTAVAIGGDTAVSSLNIFMGCIAAEIKSMDHRNWKKYRTQNPSIRN